MPRAPLLVRLGLLAIRRPGPVLALGAAVVALSLLAITRIHPTGSLDSMLAGGDSSRAMAKVMSDFAVADELIVLVTAPGSASASDAQRRLAAFASRFAAEIAQSPVMSALCEDVSFGPPAGMHSLIADHVVPAALLYVDDAVLGELADRLSTEGIRRQIHQNEEMLAASGVAGHAFAKTILRDPLRLHEILLKAWISRLPVVGSFRPDSLFLSNDGRTLMIRVAGAEHAADLDFARKLTSAVGEPAARLRDSEPQHGVDDAAGPSRADWAPLEVEFTGAYAIAVQAERSIRRDMIFSTIESIALLLLLFLLVYRSAASFFLAIVPVAFGIITAFGISTLYSTELTPVVGAIGAVLAGLSVDYSIHFMSLFAKDRGGGLSSAQAASNTLVEVTPALTAACATSMIGFVAVLISSVAALRHFALLGVLGLAGALLASITLLPAMLCVSPRPLRLREPRLLRSALLPLITWITAHARIAMLAGIVVAVASILPILRSPGEPLQLDHDLSVMHPRPNRPLQLQHQIASRFGLDPEGFIIHLQAGGGAELLTLTHRVERALHTEEVRSAGIVGSFGPASLLPDPAAIENRREELSAFDADRIVSDLRSALAESVFEPGAFEGYIEFLRRFLSPMQHPTWNTLRDYPAVARLMLPDSAWKDGSEPTQAIMVVTAAEPLLDRNARDQAIGAVRGALAGVPGATLTGISAVGHDTERTIYGNVGRLMILSFAMTIAYLIVFYRGVRNGILAMLPMIFGLVCLAGAMSAFGMRLNMVNLIGLPILVGVGVDVGVFLVSLAESAKKHGCTRAELIEKLATCSHSLLMTTVTTVFGFGTLVFTSTPAIQSLGLMLIIGVAGCLTAAGLFLIPVLASRVEKGPI